ncbi:MAG: glycosyltransferase family 4 protein [Ferruginibacter sp.]
MKILHLIYTNGIAGAEKYLKHLLPPLKNQGIECHLIMVCAPGFESPLKIYCSQLQGSGIPSTLEISTRQGFFNTARKIALYLKKHNISYLHSHLLNSDVLATIVKNIFFRNLVIISTKHGYKESVLNKIINSSVSPSLKEEAKNEFYYKVTRYVINHANYNYAVSKALSEFYFELGLSDEKMQYIHHGVNIKGQENSGVLQDRLVSGKQLIIVGRLEEFKGHQYLINAMPLVLEKFPDCKLNIIGNGSQKEFLQQLSVDLNIDKNIHFMGYINDPYSYVMNSDIIILPSLFEPFGLVYIEAFALSTPVVAFDTPAGNEIMEDKKTALLVKPGDTQQLAEKIIFLLDNPDVAKAMAERAYSEYQDNFTTTRMVKDTVAYYKKIEEDMQSVDR